MLHSFRLLLSIAIVLLNSPSQNDSGACQPWTRSSSIATAAFDNRDPVPPSLWLQRPDRRDPVTPPLWLQRQTAVSVFTSNMTAAHDSCDQLLFNCDCSSWQLWPSFCFIATAAPDSCDLIPPPPSLGRNASYQLISRLRSSWREVVAWYGRKWTPISCNVTHSWDDI